MLLIVTACCHSPNSSLTHIMPSSSYSGCETPLGWPLCGCLHLPIWADPPALAASMADDLLTLLGLPPDDRFFLLLHMPFSQHSGSNSPGWAARMCRCPLHSVWVDSPRKTHTHTHTQDLISHTKPPTLWMLSSCWHPLPPNQAVPLMSSHLTHSLWQPTCLLASKDAFHILQPYIRLLTPTDTSHPTEP